MKEDYICLEDTDEIFSVSPKNCNLKVDAYGIYPEMKLVCATMPKKDWCELCDIEEYDGDMTILAEYLNDINDDEDDILDFVIPIRKLNDESRKKINDIIMRENLIENITLA